MNNETNWQVGMTLEELEMNVILKALRFYENNKTQTAKALGIAIRTIDNKLAKYNGEAIQDENDSPKPNKRK